MSEQIINSPEFLRNMDTVGEFEGIIEAEALSSIERLYFLEQFEIVDERSCEIISHLTKDILIKASERSY